MDDIGRFGGWRATCRDRRRTWRWPLLRSENTWECNDSGVYEPERWLDTSRSRSTGLVSWGSPVQTGGLDIVKFVDSFEAGPYVGDQALIGAVEHAPRATHQQRARLLIATRRLEGPAQPSFGSIALDGISEATRERKRQGGRCRRLHVRIVGAQMTDAHRTMADSVAA